jgi:integrase
MLTWSEEELRTFLDSVANSATFALWLASADTGARKGELLGLRWRDVDCRGRIHVRQQWSRQGRTLVFGPPKTKQALRTVDVDTDTVEALRCHHDAQEFERRSWGLLPP